MLKPVDALGERDSVPRCFEEVVRSAPARTAVICGSDRLTYAELNSAANRLAHCLRECGQPGDRVAILLPDDCSVFVALLAAMKAGRVIVVLNHRDPPPRLRQLIEDSDPVAIVTGSAHAPLAVAVAGSKAVVVRQDRLPSGLPAHDRGAAPVLSDIAYLIYTSGSTGHPKALMQTHGHLVRNAHALSRTIGMTPEDRVVLVASLWGGQGTNTTWTSLLSGATLLTFPVVDIGVTGLDAWLREQKITHFFSASSLFRHFTKTLPASTTFPDIRIVKVSADAATRDDFEAFRRHFPGARMMSAMGASETGNIAYTMLSRDDAPAEGRLPVGQAFEGAEVVIVDDHGRECALGQVGSISVRSRLLGAGYWRDPDLTARTYFRNADGTRTFRGEDLGYIGSDGRLVFVGRRDATYKIRGQRVDLAEAERAIIGLPGVEDAACVVVTRPGGELRLVGYVVAKIGAVPSQRKLRAAARAFMPRHLVPSVFVVVPELPRTANGKVDRARLRQLAPPARSDVSVPPATRTEELLVRLWADAFDEEDIGRADDFFDLGGDSLIAAIIAAGIHAETGIQFPFGSFFDHPVLSEMAAVLDRVRGSGAKAERIPTTSAHLGPVPLSLYQTPYWWGSRAPAHSRRFTRASSTRIDGPLDVGAFRAALNDVVGWHEILRSRFELVGGEPAQIIEPAGEVPLPFIDLAGARDAEHQAAVFLHREGERVFDLGAGPPLAFNLLRMGDDRHLLIRASHHIITDAPSWNVFLRHLARAYEARRSGATPSPPSLTIQYADFAVWQRDVWRRDRDKYRESLAWWADQIEQAKPLSPAAWLEGYLRRKPPEKPETEDWFLRWGISARTSARLDGIGRDEAATFYMVRLAALAPLLSVLTGCESVAFGAIFTNRHRVEFEEMFGPLANIVPLIVRCDRTGSFRDLVRHVRRQVVGAQEHAEMPIDQLASGLRDRGLELPRLFFWIHVPTPTPPVRGAGIEMAPLGTAMHPVRGNITVRFNPLREEDSCVLSYDSRIYGKSGMEDLIGRLMRFMRTAADDPDAELGVLIKRAGVADRPGEGGRQAATGHALA